MLIDANGGEVATDYCACGRHKLVTSPTCCRVCAGLFNGMHSTPCHIRQESFPDTRRGVVVAGADLVPVGEMTAGGDVAGQGKYRHFYADTDR